MNIKIKKLNESAKIPAKANLHDAGFDCFANSMQETKDYIEYGLGIAIDVPEGYCLLLFPRSSISKYDLSLCNSVGIIDSGYKDEIKCRFKLKGDKIYSLGDKICQIVLYKIPEISFEEIVNLSDVGNRGGGFGSSDKNLVSL